MLVLVDDVICGIVNSDVSFLAVNSIPWLNTAAILKKNNKITNVEIIPNLS